MLSSHIPHGSQRGLPGGREVDRSCLPEKIANSSKAEQLVLHFSVLLHGNSQSGRHIIVLNIYLLDDCKEHIDFTLY